MSAKTFRNPWAWIPSLYFAEGLPYVVVMTLAVVMYKGMGLSNTDIALYTSLLYLPWVIKPFWSPVVDLWGTRRKWIWLMQLIIGAGLAGVALTVPMPDFFRWSLAFLWLLAFSSATHDIAADGYYLLATTEREQAFFVGIRSTFYRLAMISGQGLLVIFAGYIQSHTGLAKVDLQIDVRPSIVSAASVRVDSTDLKNLREGKLIIIAEPNFLQVNPQPKPRAEISEKLAAAKNQNIQNGFIRSRQTVIASAATEQNPSWWTRRISEPLAATLHRHFGPELQSKSDMAGAVCFV